MLAAIIREGEDSSGQVSVELSAVDQVRQHFPKWIGLASFQCLAKSIDHSIESTSNGGVAHPHSAGEPLQGAAFEHQSHDEIQVFMVKAQQWVIGMGWGHELVPWTSIIFK